jgi:Fibronectin type III domain
MAGEDKVKVPFIGETNKATLGIAVLAGVGALGYAYFKKKKAASATAAASGAGQYAYGYGSQYAYGSSQYSPYGYGYGPFGLGAYGGSGNYGYGYYGAGTGSPDEEVPSQASTNAEWSEATVSALTAQGFAGQDVLTALGLYLTGSPMSALQVQIVQAAIAAEGYPPVAGSNGYPPAINSGGTTGGGQTGTTPASPTGSGSTGTTGATGTTQVRAPGMPASPKTSRVTSSGFALSWPKTAGATSYRVRVTYQDKPVWENTTSGTSINVTGLTADHTYTAHVAASNAGGTSSETNGPTVHTPKK